MDKAGASHVHIDVMDGHFVPNISIGIPIIQSIRPVTDRVFDVHLMIEEPDRYIEAFVKAGADILTVHAEACRHLDRTISLIRSLGASPGVALNPATPLSAIEYVLESVDMVLLMSVNPGFGGQKFISYTYEKIEKLSKMMMERGQKKDIEVDGGVNLQNLSKLIDSGANVIVAGSAIFGGDITQNVKAFLDVMGGDT